VYTQTLFSVFTSLFVLALLIYSVLCYRKTSYVECCASFFGFFYACFLLSHVYLVREFDHGMGEKFFIFKIIPADVNRLEFTSYHL
jgi:hypothetical protein